MLNIPLVYASSAATYGGGEHGFRDDERQVADLEPLNEYGISKHEFDKWALQYPTAPPHWYGLKFFNVYGRKPSRVFPRAIWTDWLKTGRKRQVQNRPSKVTP